MTFGSQRWGASAHAARRHTHRPACPDTAKVVTASDTCVCRRRLHPDAALYFLPVPLSPPACVPPHTAAAAVHATTCGQRHSAAAHTRSHARTHAPTNYVACLCGPVGLYTPLLRCRTCARARVRACPAPLCLPSTSAFAAAAPWLVAVLIVRRATCLAFMVCTYHSKRHATTATHVSQNVVPGLALCCTKCGCMRRRRPLAPAKYQPCRVVSVTHDLGAVCCRNRSACFAAPNHSSLAKTFHLS